jgi:hypothetical protein
LCFARSDSFSAVLRASGLVFVFCASRLVFDGTQGIGSRFHVLHSLTRFRRYRRCRIPFSCFAHTDSFSAVPRASLLVIMFCAPGIVFGGTVGVGSCFHALRARTRFRRYLGCRVHFSCFTLPFLFSAIPRASGPVFTFCAPGLVFGGTGDLGSRFLVLRARTHFR